MHFPFEPAQPVIPWFALTSESVSSSIVEWSSMYSYSRVFFEYHCTAGWDLLASQYKDDFRGPDYLSSTYIRGQCGAPNGSSSGAETGSMVVVEEARQWKNNSMAADGRLVGIRVPVPMPFPLLLEAPGPGCGTLGQERGPVVRSAASEAESAQVFVDAWASPQPPSPEQLMVEACATGSQESAGTVGASVNGSILQARAGDVDVPVPVMLQPGTMTAQMQPDGGTDAVVVSTVEAKSTTTNLEVAAAPSSRKDVGHSDTSSTTRRPAEMENRSTGLPESEPADKDDCTHAEGGLAAALKQVKLKKREGPSVEKAGSDNPQQPSQIGTGPVEPAVSGTTDAAPRGEAASRVTAGVPAPACLGSAQASSFFPCSTDAGCLCRAGGGTTLQNNREGGRARIDSTANRSRPTFAASPTWEMPQRSVPNVEPFANVLTAAPGEVFCRLTELAGVRSLRQLLYWSCCRQVDSRQTCCLFSGAPPPPPLLGLKGTLPRRTVGQAGGVTRRPQVGCLRHNVFLECDFATSNE